MDKFSNWLLKQLHTREMSQSELARKAGVTRQTISYYVSGKAKDPDRDILSSIAKAFKIPIEEILEAAGIYQPTYQKEDEEKIPSLLEWIALFKDAGPDQREVMLDNARYFKERVNVKRK